MTDDGQRGKAIPSLCGAVDIIKATGSKYGPGVEAVDRGIGSGMLILWVHCKATNVSGPQGRIWKSRRQEWRWQTSTRDSWTAPECYRNKRAVPPSSPRRCSSPPAACSASAAHSAPAPSGWSSTSAS